MEKERLMNSSYIKKTLSNNKEIYVFDNVFSSPERFHHIAIAQQANYSLGSNSNHIFRNQSDTFFMCFLYDRDGEESEIFNQFGFMRSKNIDVLMDAIDNYKLRRSWIIVSSPLTKYYWHVDVSDPSNKSKTLLYYVNDKWDEEWGGETMFSNDDGECEYCVPYKPGRIVIFDGSIAHKPGVISPRAEEFRFIYVMQFVDDEMNYRHTY